MDFFVSEALICLPPLAFGQLSASLTLHQVDVCALKKNQQCCVLTCSSSSVANKSGLKTEAAVFVLTALSPISVPLFSREHDWT